MSRRDYYRISHTLREQCWRLPVMVAIIATSYRPRAIGDSHHDHMLCGEVAIFVVVVPVR